MSELKEIISRNHISLLSVFPVSDDAETARLVRETLEPRTNYSQWLAEGMHGDMKWLEKQTELKYNPSAVFEGARTVLVFGLPYFQRPVRAGGHEAGGRVSVYAWGRDYHKVFSRALKEVSATLDRLLPGEKSRALVDASPLHERWFAQASGMGFLGRHTLLITPKFGSYVFLACILSTGTQADLQPLLDDLAQMVSPAGKTKAADKCPSACRRCHEVCPTGALSGDPARMDARLCISYLTIEHKGSIPVELRKLMGSWVFGCDLCQEVCPFTAAVQGTVHPEFIAWKTGPRLDLGDLLSIQDHADMEKRFAGTALMRAGWESMVRNACIAAANTRAVHLLPVLRNLAENGTPIIREHALWAVDTLSESQSA